jgi:rod shape-determining protein MreB and related proteins
MSARDLAIDLGTSNTIVFQQGTGVVFDQPTVICVNGRSGSVLAVGRDAWAAAAANPRDAVPVRPLRRGAIVNFELTEAMLGFILHKLGVGKVRRPRALVCVPSSLTSVGRRAVEEAVLEAGARAVSLVESPLAAAIGAGLPIHDPVGNMVVDVGGGISEMAMLALGGIVMSRSAPVGGFDVDEGIRAHLRAAYELGVGEVTAEHIKVEVGSAYPAADAPDAEVRGRDLTTGEARTVVLRPEEVREILAPAVETLVDATRRCLAESPPDLAHDVLETGLFLTGGGALLRGLDMRLAQDCEVPVHLTEHPLSTVAIGAGRLLDYEPDQREAFLRSHRPVP